MIMTQNLVNPVHFFDRQGHGMLSNEHLVAENKRLEAELARVRRLLEAQVRKARAAADTDEEKAIH